MPFLRKLPHFAFFFVLCDPFRAGLEIVVTTWLTRFFQDFFTRTLFYISFATLYGLKWGLKVRAFAWGLLQVSVRVRESLRISTLARSRDFLSFDVLPDICQPWMMCTSCHTEVSWNDMTFLGHDGVHLCCFTPSMLWPPLICEAFGVAFPLLFYNTDIVQASILQVNRQLFIPSFTIHLCMNINLSQRPEPL